MKRPISSSTATAATEVISQRRGVMSDLHALSAKPALHLAANRRQALLGERLVTGDEYRLCVRRPDQSPSVTEQHPHSIDVDHLVLRLEMSDRFAHDRELDLLG